MRVEQTPNKSQHRKLTLQKKILLPLLPGFKLTDIDYEFGTLPTLSYPDPIFMNTKVTFTSCIRFSLANPNSHGKNIKACPSFSMLCL